MSEETRHKISNTLKSKYASGEIQKKKGCEIAGWNKGLKCPKIGETRRNMFGSVEVYDKNMNLIVTFRSVTDLCEWSKFLILISISNKFINLLTIIRIICGYPS